MYVDKILWKEKIHFRENRPIFLGIWGEAELILRIWGAKENTFRELRKSIINALFSGIKGAQTSGGGGGGSKMRTFSFTLHYFA